MTYLNTVSSFFSSVFAQINTQYSAACAAASLRWAAITAVCASSLQDLSSWMTTRTSGLGTRSVTVNNPTNQGEVPARSSSESDRATKRLQSTVNYLVALPTRVSHQIRGGNPASSLLDLAEEKARQDQVWLTNISCEIIGADWAKCPTVSNVRDGVVVKERAESFAPRIFTINKADRAHSLIGQLVLLEWALRLTPSFQHFTKLNEGLIFARAICKEVAEIDFSFSLLDAVGLQDQVMRDVEVGVKNKDTQFLLCPMIGIAEDETNHENVVDSHYNPISFKKFKKPELTKLLKPLRFNLKDENHELVFYAVILVNTAENKIKVNLVLELHGEALKRNFNQQDAASITDFIHRFGELEDKRIDSFMKQVFQTGA
jgi:hypothetical protein